MSDRDYGMIMLCRKCSWRGPFYLLLVPMKYPGTARCPECKADEPMIEDKPTA